jgi:hypothetical protein
MQMVTTIILDIVNSVFQAHGNDAVGCETADFGIWPQSVDTTGNVLSCELKGKADLTRSLRIRPY